MKKLFTLTVCLLVLLSIPYVARAIDVSSAIVQVKIYDEALQTFVSTGSGVSFSVNSIITNYHVVSDAVTNPNRYSVFVCVVRDGYEETQCIYRAYLDRVYGTFEVKPEYQSDIDIAIIHINYAWIDGKWQSIMDIPLNEFSFPIIDPAYNGFDSSQLPVGTPIQTYGFPAFATNLLTRTDGHIIERNDLEDILGHYVIDNLIGPGSSGGAALSTSGDLIGITSSGWTDEGGNFIAGRVIPVSWINSWWVNDLGYRINTRGEYTTLGEGSEKVSANVTCLLGGGVYYSDNSVCKYPNEVSELECLDSEFLNANKQCVSEKELLDASCAVTFHASHWTGTIDPNVSHDCICNDGSNWFAGEQSCKYPEEENISFASSIDIIMNQTTIDDHPIITFSESVESIASSIEQHPIVERTKGMILLQVEEHGEAWYVNPLDGKRYYMKDGTAAFSLMRGFALGITNSDIEKIPRHDQLFGGDNALRSRLSGRILLQVEEQGDALYMYPEDDKRYFLGLPGDAYDLMRDLGLGITNADLEKIPVGTLEINSVSSNRSLESTTIPVP